MTARTGHRTGVSGWLVALMLFVAPLAHAGAMPQIAIIIDDLGDNRHLGETALALPGALTYAILPQTPYATRFAEMAYAEGKEVMIHQPMSAYDDSKALGPGAMTVHMTHRELAATLRANLVSVPHARGLNNHMGSLLTRHPGQMAWLMDELRKNGLYFVDSRTSSESVAMKVAVEHATPTLGRNIFLDSDRSPEAIAGQAQRLLNKARYRGTAVAIGHPYPETLAMLREWLPTLVEEGIELVPVSTLVIKTNHMGDKLWQASLYPWLKDSKNSKP